ncbi:hypothetical protein [Geosporobacter ferrireducens]|uniref:Uncharacterized protein n=1 Tax=Geosporobacter ferrireducens TaxID=1424294 RepID=A0A1D8GHK5_9FIRM|nr:hypothetical protein [Geosporobacter ferrireducens]AOT70379.1 hypothetical protein Gferi_12720 [Geosporobacter ferrireducens]
MIIKSSFIKVKVLLLLTIVFFVTISCAACNKKIDEKPSKYLIDIEVVNKTNLKIDYLELYEFGKNWEYLITKAYENEDGYVHFAISYNKDSNFYIQGSVDQKEVKKYEFDLHGFDQVYTKQTLYIYLIRNEDGRFELQK